MPLAALYFVFWAVFFKGAYSPQKMTQKTSIETRYKPFQRRVSFYILKISKGCFAWAAPPLRTGAIINRIPLYFPQKWDLLPPFQQRFKLFQGHVLSY
jgi:hypothetical protein